MDAVSLYATSRYPVSAFEDDLEQPGDGRWASNVLAGDRNPWRYPPNPKP